MSAFLGRSTKEWAEIDSLLHGAGLEVADLGALLMEHVTRRRRERVKAFLKDYSALPEWLSEWLVVNREAVLEALR